MVGKFGSKHVLVLTGLALVMAVLGFAWFSRGHGESPDSGALRPASPHSDDAPEGAKSAQDSNDKPAVAQAGEPNGPRPPVPSGLGPPEDSASNRLQVDILRNMYSEASHDIKELPLPSGPVLLQLRHTARDKGSSYKMRLISVEEWPLGMTVGRIGTLTTHVDDVDENQNTAEMTDSFKTTATFGVDIVTDSVNVGNLDISQSYTLSGSGTRQSHNTEWKSENISSVHIIGDALQALALPPTAIQPNQKHSMNMESAVKDLPEQWKEPPKLDVTLTGHVMFDGQEAYRLETDHTGYGAVQIPLSFVDLKEPVKMKIRTKGKSYVSVETGRVLWSDMRMEVVDCTFPAGKGMAASTREELVPE